MRHGSLFSGIGGFDLAAEWMGWENVFHCEWMEFPRKVLDYHFPNADSHIDICKTDFKKYANTIDILTGGFPCQPFSLAGKRKGTDDERYLWGEMLRAIQEIKPRFVIAENVFGITSIDGGLVFQQVCLDLEAEGYEVQPFVIPACAKNAPHRRDRVWFVAQNPLHRRCLHGRDEQEGAEVREFGDTCTRDCNGIYLSKRNASNSNGFRYRRGCEQSATNQSQEQSLGENEQQHRDGVWCEVEGCCWDATNNSGKGLERQHREWSGLPINRSNEGLQFGTKNQFNATNANGTSAQCRDGKATKGREKQGGRIESFSFNMEWEKFPTQSPICGGDDGLPTELDGITFSKWRAESIKGYGNAIVPQIAYQLFQIINDL
jgi:DNA (cytosine-5)-methyltransferase 1